MHRPHTLTRSLSPSFSALRVSLLAALGLSAAACGGNVIASGSSTGGTGGAGGATLGSACESPTPILQPDGSDSGFVRCADGAIDRVSVLPCAADPANECTTDADCVTGESCVCRGVISWVTGSSGHAMCLTGSCHTSADCPSGECGYSEYGDGCGNYELHLFCRGADDECRSASTCIASEQCATNDKLTPFMCLADTCTIGRPLFARGILLFAPAERRADWAEQTAPCPREEQGPSPDRPQPEELRAALAAHFTAMAAMEHASVGSFARFSLELLSMGAPPSLLRAAHEAALDEIEHARLAYSLASAYADEPVGPGRLDVTGVAPSADEREIVTALVREACVGETTAAAEALEISTLVTDPALREAYARIARDESRHAELGWRCLAWMLNRSPELRSTAERAFSRAMESISAAPLVASDVVAPEHGLLSSASLADLRARAAEEIVGPCRRALLSPAAVSRSLDAPSALQA